VPSFDVGLALSGDLAAAIHRKSTNGALTLEALVLFGLSRIMVAKSCCPTNKEAAPVRGRSQQNQQLPRT
jgi:hypothetical protein